MASSTQVPTAQLKLVGTQTLQRLEKNKKRRTRKKDYCLLLQDQVGKFCGRRKKLSLLQGLLYGWRCSDRHASKSLAQEAFLCLLHSRWAWLCSAHGRITTYSITAFFSLILLLNFPSGAFRGLYSSSVSLVERRQVSHTSIQVGMSQSRDGDARQGLGEAGKLLLGMGTTVSIHHTAARAQLLQPLLQKTK